MIRAGAGQFSLVEYKRRAGFAALQANGLVEDAGLLKSVRCDECDQSHDALIIYSDDEGTYGWNCYDCGFIPIAKHRIGAVRVSLPSLVAALASSLVCRNLLGRALIDGVLWRVGVFDRAGHDIGVYLATRIGSIGEAQRCAGVISAEPRRTYRVLITPELENIRGFQVAGCSFAKLDEVASIDPALGVIVSPGRLAAIAGIPTVRAGGRPSPYQPMLDQVIETRHRDGQALDAINAEERAIRKVWPSLNRSGGSPSESVVKRAITSFRARS